MTSAADRAALAEALGRVIDWEAPMSSLPPSGQQIIDALAPVVDAIARRRAAAQFTSLLAVSPQLFGANGELRGYIVSLPLLSTIGIDADAVSRTLAAE